MGEEDFSLPDPLVQPERLLSPLGVKELVPLVTRDFVHPSDIYAICKQIDGMPTANGTFPLCGCRVTNFLEQRLRQRFYESLSDTGRIITVLVMNHHLREGGVPSWLLPGIQVAFETFRSIFDADDGRVPFPQPGEDKIGDHAVALTGNWKDSGGWLHFINSWGPDWGDQGAGFLSRKYLDQFLIDAWLIRDARIGLSSLTYRQLMDSATPRERALAWMRHNPRWKRRGHRNGRGYQLVVYETLSIQEECPVQVIELRTGYGIRVGWAHLYHLGKRSRTSLLKELFVWPSFRQQGYGSVLEELASLNARAWHSERLQVLLHEMDALPSSRPVAERFAERTVYRWIEHRGERPVVVAMGEKVL